MDWMKITVSFKGISYADTLKAYFNFQLAEHCEYKF